MNEVPLEFLPTDDKGILSSRRESGHVLVREDRVVRFLQPWDVQKIQAARKRLAPGKTLLEDVALPPPVLCAGSAALLKLLSERPGATAFQIGTRKSVTYQFETGVMPARFAPELFYLGSLYTAAEVKDAASLEGGYDFTGLMTAKVDPSVPCVHMGRGEWTALDEGDGIFNPHTGKLDYRYLGMREEGPHGALRYGNGTLETTGWTALRGKVHPRRPVPRPEAGLGSGA